MPSLAVVEDLDVLRDLSPGLRPGFVTPVMYEFVLQRPPKTFHRCIVVTIPPPGHRSLQPQVFQARLVVLRAILDPAIGVMKQAGGRPSAGDGLHEGRPHQVSCHPGVHRMADHLAGEQILDAGEIEPAFRGRHVRDVGDPGLVRSGRDKRLGQDIRCHRQGMMRFSGRPEPPHLLAAKSQLLTEPLDAPNPGSKAVLAQFGLQPFRAIRLAAAPMGRLDRHLQPRVLLGAHRGAAGAPGVVPASGYVQGSTQDGERILKTQRRHQCVPGSCAFAKYAVAFFKMSRSIRASASWRFS